MTLYGWPSVSLVSTSADRKADCTSLRGESVGNERWNKALLSLGVGGEPGALGLALSTVLPNTRVLGRCLNRWGGPGADAVNRSH